MLLKRTKRKGSLCLELLLYLPLVALLFFSLLCLQLFYLESLCLDQATYETAKAMVSLEIAGEPFASMLSQQSDLALTLLGRIGLQGPAARQFILVHDASGYLREENMETAELNRTEGMLLVRCSYRSSFLPGVTMESRAAERSWKP